MILEMLRIADTGLLPLLFFFIDDLTAVESGRMNLAAAHSAE